jgi:hypothetical protein
MLVAQLNAFCQATESPQRTLEKLHSGKIQGNTITGTVSFADGAATANFRAQKK